MARKAKKIQKTTPSGKRVVKRGRKKPSASLCSKCGAKLHGMPKARPSAMMKIAPSKRTPNRPYGGNLCSRCMRETLKNRVE